jgi:hypothetical protein
VVASSVLPDKGKESLKSPSENQLHRGGHRRRELWTTRTATVLRTLSLRYQTVSQMSLNRPPTNWQIFGGATSD